MRFVRNLSLIVVVVLLSACAVYPVGAARMVSAEDVPEIDPALKLRWHHAEQPRATAVVVHGLNLNPDAMRDIERALYDADMDVLAVSLSGHESGADEQLRLARFRQASFPVWQQEVEQAVEHAALHAEAQQLPLFLVGFSMGGLLTTDYVNRHPHNDVDKMVLLAPALSLRWTSYLLMPLSVLPNFFLPSIAPDAYRANNYSPVSAYESLYEGLQQFIEQAQSEHLQLPVLVLIDPRDELVSVAGMESLLEELSLESWQLQEVNKSVGAETVMSHLILGPHSLGEQGWEDVRNRMLDFLVTSQHDRLQE
jgi:esterase/lipase